MKKISNICILDSNEMSAENLKYYIEELYPDCEINIYTDSEKVFDELVKFEDKIILFMDMSNEDSFYEGMLDKIKNVEYDLVAMSTDYSIDKIISSMRIGAKEFLPKPILREDLKKILGKLFNNQDVKNESTSKIITIYSNKGGIGKTTIATNLAMELSNISGDKVALIDLNLHIGDVATFLNLNPTLDIVYMIKIYLNKNGTSLLDKFEKYRDTNLYVLADPQYIENSKSITPQDIEYLLNVLKKEFSYIVIDMASILDANSFKVLDSSDFILFTTIINIPTIRNIQRCLNLLKSRRYSNNKIKLIINRYVEGSDISIEDIEDTLGESVYWKIPNNYFSIMDAINKGVTVNEISPNSNIANNFKDLAFKISEDIIKETIIRYRGL